MKKLLAMLLAAAMMLSLLPATFAAEESLTTHPSYEYVFNNAAHGIAQALADEINATKGEDETKVTVDGLRPLRSGYHTIERTVTSASSGRWGFLNVKTASGYATNEDNTIWHYSTTPGIKPFFTRGTGYDEKYHSMAIAFEIEVPQGGVYKPSVTFQKYYASPKFDVYLLPKPADSWHYADADGDVFFRNVANLGANEYLGSVDLWGANGDNSVATDNDSLRPVNLSEGNYYLVFVGNGTNEQYTEEAHTNGNYYIRTKLNAFTLTAVTKPVDLEYKTTIDVFDTDNMKLTGDSSEYSKEGYVRNSDGGLLYTASLSYKAKSSLNKAGEPLDTAVNVMKLSLTDPWEFAYEHGSTRLTKNAGGVGLSLNSGGYHSTTSGDFVAFRLIVPHTGKYKISVKNALTSNAQYGAVANVYMGKDTTKTATNFTKTSSGSVCKELTKIGEFNFSTAPNDSYTDVGEIELVAGENLIAFVPNAMSRVKNPVTNSGDLTSYINPETGAITHKYTNSAGKEVTGLPPTNSEGKAISWQQFIYLSGIKLTAINDGTYEEQMSEYNENLNAYNAAQNVDKGEVEAVAAPTQVKITLATADVNGSAVAGAQADGSGTYDVNALVTVSANEPTGYKFSHWAVGANGMVASESREYTFNAGSSTRLTAIYVPTAKAETTTVVYYAADGSEESRTSVASGSEITLPALPQVIGGTSSNWKGTDGKTYAANEKVTVSGSLAAFVADFAANTYTVTANGTISNANPAYGEKVTITAAARENITSGNSFNYWQNESGEIVSFDRSYSFYAYRNCEYTAVYKQFEPISKTLRKIILNKDGLQLMAEFIGFDNTSVVERGILFGTNLSNFSAKAVMKTDAKQFAVYNDTGATATAYAVLSDGTVVYSN